MRVYIKPPKKGVFSPRTSPETKHSKKFTASYGDKTRPLIFLVIDHGKIDRVHGKFLSYWCHEDYYSRKVPKK